MGEGLAGGMKKVGDTVGVFFKAGGLKKIQDTTGGMWGGVNRYFSFNGSKVKE